MSLSWTRSQPARTFRTREGARKTSFWYFLYYSHPVPKSMSL